MELSSRGGNVLDLDGTSTILLVGSVTMATINEYH